LQLYRAAFLLSGHNIHILREAAIEPEPCDAALKKIARNFLAAIYLAASAILLN